MFSFKTDLKYFINYINAFNIDIIPISILDKWYIDYEFAFNFTNNTSRLEYLNECCELNEDYTSNNDYPYSVRNAIDTLVSIYKMDERQFKVYDSNNVTIVSVEEIPDFITFPCSIFVPIVKKNIEIMDIEMKHAGYYHVADKQYKDKKGRSWINIVYDPIKQESITYQVKHYKRYLYHFSPEENEQSIIENGLVPSNEQRLYHFYQPRVYLLTTEPESEWFKKMIRNVHHNRKKKNLNINDLYNIYEIRTKNIPDYIEFFRDPHGKESMYVIDTIPYSCISSTEKIKVI